MDYNLLLPQRKFNKINETNLSSSSSSSSSVRKLRNKIKNEIRKEQIRTQQQQSEEDRIEDSKEDSNLKFNNKISIEEFLYEKNCLLIFQFLSLNDLFSFSLINKRLSSYLKELQFDFLIKLHSFVKILQTSTLNFGILNGCSLKIGDGKFHSFSFEISSSSSLSPLTNKRP